MATHAAKGQQAVIAALTLNRGELDPDRLSVVLTRLAATAPKR
jgi:hypothetical protein